ncbi:hypothetical protein IJ541_09750 [bacterium]|nr:hypothetical protein [bacterium]
MFQNFNSVKVGFTLAEALITLGVIGVVVAITIPTLISNYQKKTWTAQLLKTRAVLEQGLRRALAEQDVTDFSASDCHGSDNFENCMAKYFKATKLSFNNYTQHAMKNEFGYENDASIITAMALPDGTLVIDVGRESMGQLIAIDVNGQTKPNIYGRDVFFFAIGTSKSGSNTVHPIGLGGFTYNSDGDDSYIDYAVEAACALYWGDCNGHIRTEDGVDITDEAIAIINDISSQIPGAGYTSRVIKLGKMDY